MTAQPLEQGYNRCQAQHYAENVDIPELEENSEEEQFGDFDSFMAHHNTHHPSEHIQQQYSSQLQDLDDNQYYAEIDRANFPQYPPAPQDYRLANHQVTHEDPWKNYKEYLERAEVKPDEKSYVVTDDLAQELVPCKVTFNARSRRISVYAKGTLPTVNILIL